MTGPAIDPLADYTPAWKGQADPLADYHPAWRSQQLVAKMQRENANDAEAAAVPEPGYLSRLATHVLNTAQGIPGMEAVEAYAGHLGSKLTDHPMSYTESLNTLRNQTGNIGGKTSALEHIMGSVATMPFLPKNPAMAGALLGGADQALSADPITSAGDVVSRVGKTALGAGAGYVTGKALDQLVTAAKTLRVPNASANVIAQKAARGNAADVAYAKALTEGQGATNTPAINAVLQHKDVQPIVNDLLQLDEFAGKQPHDPEVLDAVYKSLSDQAKDLQKGLSTAKPSSANVRRYALRQVNSVKQSLLDAMSGTNAAPGPMPSYRSAVEGYARSSGNVAATQRGSDLIKGIGGTLPAGTNLDRLGPEAFAKWAETASPEQKASAVDGILGALKQVDQTRWRKILGMPVMPAASKAMAKAPGLLRLVDPNAGAPATAGLLGVRGVANEIMR